VHKFLESLLKRGLAPYLIAAVVLLAGVTGVVAETGAFSGSPSPTPSAADSSAGSAQAVGGYPAAGGGDNIVQVINHADSHFRMDGKVKLDQIPGPTAGPKNEAIAFSSCTGCQTMAVALQINLISPEARNIQPLNKGSAVNYRCTSCVTYGRAIQYDIQVVDTSQIPSDVRELMRQMDATLNHIKTSDDSFDQALAEVNGVIAQFKELAGYLDDKAEMTTDPTTPGASPLPPSPAPSSSPSQSGAPAESPTPSPQPSPTSSV